MKIFVWTDVNNVSANYHSDGGLTVIAETLERARELIAANCRDDEGRPCEALTKEPDLTDEGGTAEHIFVFPNAGCC